VAVQVMKYIQMHQPSVQSHFFFLKQFQPLSKRKCQGKQGMGALHVGKSWYSAVVEGLH
jgi:hypothetical protein